MRQRRKPSSAKRRAQIAASKRRHVAAIADIEIKPYVISTRRFAAQRDLRLFCETYLKRMFPLPFSADHLEALEKIQHAALVGGSFAVSSPRSDGKTQRALAGILWVCLNGHSRFALALAATELLARRLLREIVQELSDNDLLATDWPEICLPIREAYGKPNRAGYITLNGEPVRLELVTTKLAFPTWSKAPQQLGGTIIASGGILSAVRGVRHKTANGETVRPDFCLVDDPQTRKSANSVQQCNLRLAILRGDVKRLAGPDKELRCVVNLTVIRKGDVADQLLDQKKHPEFRGVRKAFVIRWPDAVELWDTYKELRRNGLLDGDGGRAANEFYRGNREVMDKGALCGWEHRFRPELGEVSAIQCAMNILNDDGPEAFAAEMQNSPIQRESHIYEITPEIVASRVNKLPAGEAPTLARIITAFVDVNRYGLSWCVCAWQSNMTGHVIGYGIFPEGRPVFDPKNPGSETESQALFRCLVELGQGLTRQGAWMRDGQPATLDCLMVDCGYLPETVLQFCRLTPLATMRVASRGRAARTFNQRGNAKLIRRGDNWRVDEWSQGNVLIHNSDAHRMALHGAWLLPHGAPGGLTVFGDQPAQHIAFARQVTAERLGEYVRGDIADHFMWRAVPGERNDWLDAIVGCRVGALYLLGVNGQQQVAQGVPAQPAQPAPAQQSAKPAQPRPAQRPRSREPVYLPGWEPTGLRPNR